MSRVCLHCGVSIEGRPEDRNYCSRSCGAHVSKNKRHGLTDTPLHRTWKRIRERCTNPNNHNYPRYGGRGITVCGRWDSFENFIDDMGEKPTPEHTIDRIDGNGNYEPSNCRWATMLEQNHNRSINYTATQDQALRDGFARRETDEQIAVALGKSAGSVRCRAARIGLGRKAFKSPPRAKGGE